MSLSRNQKRSITYTVITVLLIIVAINNNEETNFVGYMAGLGYLISGFVAFLCIISVIGEKIKGIKHV